MYIKKKLCKNFKMLLLHQNKLSLLIPSFHKLLEVPMYKLTYVHKKPMTPYPTYFKSDL